VEPGWTWVSPPPLAPIPSFSVAMKYGRGKSGVDSWTLTMRPRVSPAERDRLSALILASLTASCRACCDSSFWRVSSTVNWTPLIVLAPWAVAISMTSFIFSRFLTVTVRLVDTW